MPRSSSHRRIQRLGARLSLLWLVGVSPLALATVNVPEALSQGTQVGANGEAAVSGTLGQMQGTVQNSTGVSNVQATGNPANGAGSSGGGTATGSYPFVISCATNTPSNPIFPGGYGLSTFNCLYQGSGQTSSVNQFTLEVCLASTNGGNCSVGSSNWQQTNIGPGQTVQLSSTVSVSLASCPANGLGQCSGELTVANSTIEPMSAGALTNNATNIVSAGTNGYQNSLNGTFNSGNYQTSIQTGNASYQLQSCTQQIKGGLEGNGIVYTCNGQQSADFNSNCTTTTQCVQYATESQNYTQTCNQNLPLTEQSCTTVTPTQNCTISASQTTYGCAIYNTASVVGSPGVPTSSTANLNVFGVGAAPITAATNGSNNSVTLTGSVVWSCYGGNCASCNIGSITLAPGQCADNNCANGGCGTVAQFCYTGLAGGTATYTTAMANYYRGSCPGFTNTGSASVAVISSTESIQYSYDNPNNCSIYQQSS